MREWLRSSGEKEEKAKLDLNNDPVEEDGSSLLSTDAIPVESSGILFKGCANEGKKSECISLDCTNEAKCDLNMNVFASSNMVLVKHEDGVGEKRKKVESLKEEGGVFEGDLNLNKSTMALNLNDVASIEDSIFDSSLEKVNGDECDLKSPGCIGNDVCVKVGLNAGDEADAKIDSDNEVSGTIKGRRGRKRKEKKGNDNPREGEELVKGELLVPDRETGETNSTLRVVNCCKVPGVIDTEVVNSGGDEGMNAIKCKDNCSKGRRGRKRKMQVCGSSMEKVDNRLLHSRQNVGRVLRSRMKAMASDGTHHHDEEREGIDDENKKRAIDHCEKESFITDKVEGRSVRAGKELKRRGRPPKRLTGTKVTAADDKQHPDEEREGIEDENKNRAMDICYKKNIIINKEEIGRLVRAGKKLKRGRGRPPKMLMSDRSIKATIRKKDMVTGCNKNSRHEKLNLVTEGSMLPKRVLRNRPSDMVSEGTEKIPKSKAESNVKFTDDGNEQPDSGMKISSKDLKTIKHKKDKEMGLNEEKQLIRQQIIDILMKAGWTIDYRPRNGRNYMDSVYVDREGRTYWSVTKAYHTLRRKVEEGAAHEEEASSFTLIAEEVIAKLFRVVTKKRSDMKEKQNKGGYENGGPIKRGSNDQSVVRKLDGSKRKRLNSGTKSTHKSSSKRSKGELLHPEHHNLTGRFHKTKKRSKTEGRNRKGCALLARSSTKGSEQDGDGYQVYEGKRSLLSWMIDSGTVSSSSKVMYLNSRRTKVMLEGKVTSDGILCDCCNEILQVLDFEFHAGSKLGQPFRNIYIESGPNLLQCLVDSWTKQEEIGHIGFHAVDVDSDDPNDDTCNICGDGGDLLCCDGCPSTFHQSCLSVENFPPGDWHCVYCSCKFCGSAGEGSDQTDMDIDEIVSGLLTCHLCEEKFHMNCIQGKGGRCLDSEEPSFCGEDCQKLFELLQELLGVRHELKDGFSWTVLQRRDINKDVSLDDDSNKIEWSSKLAVANSILDECFVPIIDHRSRINMIHNVTFSCGSNVKRLNYSGFYTVILERGDELISAASIRIHGRQLAEMPFIGTRYMYRRQGMCRRLLGAVEMALSSVGVAQLVIPAISELNETWTKVFGFMPLEDSKRREMRHMSMIVFPGTSMLQKPLLKHQSSEVPVTPAAELAEDQNKTMLETSNKYEQNSGGCVNDTSDIVGKTIDLSGSPDVEKSLDNPRPSSDGELVIDNKSFDAPDLHGQQLNNHLNGPSSLGLTHECEISVEKRACEYSVAILSDKTCVSISLESKPTVNSDDISRVNVATLTSLTSREDSADVTDSGVDDPKEDSADARADFPPQDVDRIPKDGDLCPQLPRQSEPCSLVERLGHSNDSVRQNAEQLF